MSEFNDAACHTNDGVDATQQNLVYVMEKVSPPDETEADKFKPNDILWHYTTAATFMAFFSNPQANTKLYATDVRFCNDDREIREGIQKYTEFMDKESYLYSSDSSDSSSSLATLSAYLLSDNEAKKTGNFELFSSRNNDQVSTNGSNIPTAEINSGEIKKIRDKYNFYVICFSAEPDSLGQWISYTSKKEGGFAIGFSRESLEKKINTTYGKKIKIEGSNIIIGINKDKNEWMIIGDCQYSNKDKEILYNAVKEYFQKQSNVEEYAQDVRNLLPLILISLFKDESFAAEKETRIVVIRPKKRNDDICFIGEKPRIPTIFEDIISYVNEICISPQGDRSYHERLANIVKEFSGGRIELKQSKSSYNAR